MVSEADREHFRRIGEFQRQSAAEERARWEAMTVAERFRDSIQRSAAAVRANPELAKRWEDEDPTAFHRYAKKLGHYDG